MWHYFSLRQFSARMTWTRVVIWSWLNCAQLLLKLVLLFQFDIFIRLCLSLQGTCRSLKSLNFGFEFLRRWKFLCLGLNISLCRSKVFFHFLEFEAFWLYLAYHIHFMMQRSIEKSLSKHFNARNIFGLRMIYIVLHLIM